MYALVAREEHQMVEFMFDLKSLNLSYEIKVKIYST